MLAAVEKGDVKKLAELMRQDPGFNVNKDHEDGDGRTLLYVACREDIPLLLAHPDIDVNVKNEFGVTAFCLACANGHTSSVRLLLKDSRVKVNEPTNSGSTPLQLVARDGCLDVIRWWIVSGREMDLGEPGDVEKTDAIGVAEEEGMTEVVALLERFKSDAAQTRHAMRVELGLLDDLAAEMFALVVFVSDGLLQTNDSTTTTPAARFFNIARRLPLELQMMLCFRQVGSTKEIIAGKESEVAFKELARRLW